MNYIIVALIVIVLVLTKIERKLTEIKHDTFWLRHHFRRQTPEFYDDEDD